MLGLLIPLSTWVHAEQWYVEPRASLQAFYDDNVRLSVASPVSSSGGTATGEVEAGRRSEISDIGLSAKVIARRYADASDLDETDSALGFTSAYQWGLSRFGLDASFDYDSTLTSEIATSGLVQVNKRRERVLVSPSWTYNLGSRAQARAGASYQEITYEDVELIPLFNYSFATADLTLTYGLSERATLFGRASYAKYDADQVDTTSDSVGAEVGASYALSETLALTTYAGLRNTKAETPTLLGTEETENSGPLFQLELKKTFDRGQLRVSADRSVVPSSSGTLLDTTALAASVDYELAPRWKFLFSARGYRNRTPDGESSGYDRDYFSFSPGIRHKLTRSLSVDLSYRYRWQEYDSRDKDAVSNAVFLSLRYSMPRDPLSRWSGVKSQ
ncbi:outer membrane beta-barrel protein [Thiorhodococcus minor]|uniref:Outer membrane beta-barrel protein n=1 Tax=Thiorhodococcus minor TaxID=57489 RepID=A0A6M0JWQ8_9GAMM|nr:outer membrane beta-barrel protein [Thiorhodococcus minor]NEV60737.1 outer membrane beta-barrel protein [Thiorhodococcus minor]